MRRLLLALLVACGGSPAPRPIDVTTVPTNEPTVVAAPITAVAEAWREGPGGFPLPSDADAGTQMMGTDTTFVITRTRDEVHQQLRTKLAADGYVIDEDKVAMGGHRMKVHKDDQAFLVSVTDNDGATLLTVTVKTPR